MEEKHRKWYTDVMSIGGIGGIGGGRGGYIATGSPAPGGPGDDGPKKPDDKKKVEEKKKSDAAAELQISTPAEAIEQLEQLTHDALAHVAPETLDFIAAEHAVMIDPILQQRVADVRRKMTIVRGARAYGMSQYPLPVQPVEPVAPVNPDPETIHDVPERDEEKEAQEETPEN